MIRKLAKSQNGTSMLELALAMPFLLVTFLSVLEAIKFCRYEEYLSVASRESGRSVFSCAYAILETGENLDGCLQNKIESTFQNGGLGIPIQPDIIVRVWEHTSDLTPANLVGEFTQGGSTSRYNGTTIQGLHSYTAEKQRIVTAEAFFSTPPLIQTFSGDYYSVTIF